MVFKGIKESMHKKNKTYRTMVGKIRSEALAYTAGNDVTLDMLLVNADCIASAAHVTMLSKLSLGRKLFSVAEKNRIIRELVKIMHEAQRGKFVIKLKDQDVHLAIERILTKKIGVSAENIHTGRSRNDQIAVDLRLFAKEELLKTIEELLALSSTLLETAKKNRAIPMVGRTHMQPAMPSSVGLWASAYVETFHDDIALLRSAYDLNNECPLGSAAGYGVPLPIDRQETSDLLAFSQPQHNVLHASNSRGKMESITLFALSQVMLTLSRLAQDIILFSMPEFDYFTLPPELCTGSSILPQKNNPDILELVRARATSVISFCFTVMELVKGLPAGYSRDLQETKEPFLKGFQLTRSSLRIMTLLLKSLKINRESLLAGFKPEVFATDYALERVKKGSSFRKAFSYLKTHLDELQPIDPSESISSRSHLGAAAKLDFNLMTSWIDAEHDFVNTERKHYFKVISRLLKVAYPLKD